MDELIRDCEVLPSVSVIMPVLNEARHIVKCMETVLGQHYPSELVEILIADGGSTDGSVSILEDIARAHDNVYLFSNPARFAPHGLNLCLKHAKNEVVVRLDAHALYPPNYVAACVAELTSGKADCVGGAMIPVADTYFTKAVSAVVTSTFGTGGARYRTSSESEYVDTVWLGTWYRMELTKLGGFNEALHVNQDYELAYRLRRAGGRVLLSQKIRGQYKPRANLAELSRQYFQYGFWKVRMLREHPRSLRMRQVLPTALVANLLFSVLLLPISTMPFLALASLYFTAVVSASLISARQKGWNLLPLLPMVFATLHFSWGLGALWGWIHWMTNPPASTANAEM